MLNDLLLNFHEWLVDLRRQFHQIPELCYKEEKTAAKICHVLEQMNIPYQKGVGGTGVVAKLKAERDGPVVAYRADMDALPLVEANDVSYRSQHKGVMHACGHDGHMTIALGIIRWLMEKNWPQTGCGQILFFLQPAEEGGAGAKAMIDTGLFDQEPVKAILAGHVNPELPVGKVELISGTAHAATTEFHIRIKGKGGHGAAPHLCIDPIMAGAYLVTQLQGIVSRNLSPLDSAVVTIGEFHAGTTTNIIPEDANLTGTVRTLSPSVQTQTIRRIEEIVKSLNLAFGASAVMENIEGYPVQVNDPGMIEFMKSCVKDVLGTEGIFLGNPRMGGEDFAYFCEKWPGVMIGLGCHDPAKGFQFALHSPHFEMDERVLDVGVQLFGHALVQCLETTFPEN